MTNRQDLERYSNDELLDELDQRQSEEQALIDWVVRGASGGRYTGAWTIHRGFAQEYIHFDTKGLLWAKGPRVPIHSIALDHYLTTGEACGFWPLEATA